MRLNKARITPVSNGELSESQSSIMQNLNEAARNLNLFRTTLSCPESMEAMLGWSNYIGSKKANDVPWRDKEIIVLRTSYMCKSGYEWSLHVFLGESAGLSKDEIASLRDGNDHDWDEKDAAIIALCDELARDYFVSDETWQALSKYYNEKQMMDAVYTAAHYGMVSKFANSFGVQIDKGIQLHDSLRHIASD